MGISSLMQTVSRERISSSSVRAPYLRVVGIQIETNGGGRSNNYYTPQEEEEMQMLARDPDIYNKIVRSIAPQISGDYTTDIKKALACLLFGGSRKVLPDGVRLRGDINVLLMGDPSTAKSQLLKYIERIAPIGVYTSGKGSSAAGLTATVIKDSRGEFFLEGGAMVLADGGVICIDEFDKMRETDRVAIHEAMEQQTISIAKAGITTVLNCRTSVLAAANPIYGRYDDYKSVGENIDLMTTILSRFDCIFIIRDIRDISRDRNIAKHVLSVHISSNLESSSSSGASGGGGASSSSYDQNLDISSPKLKKFISYCRDRCSPRLSDEGAAILSSQYVHIRNQVRLALQDTPGESQVIPITIRQLEALIRLSESLAKMRLSAEATINDVEEAIRLFKISTLAASQSNPSLLGNGIGTAETVRAEDFLRRRLGIKMTVNSRKIIEEALNQGHGDESIKRALSAMIMRGEIQELNQRKLLRRIR
jgi:DNA replication licensing factor MCM5